MTKLKVTMINYNLNLEFWLDKVISQWLSVLSIQTDVRKTNVYLTDRCQG
jgi:hypothetical protein